MKTYSEITTQLQELMKIKKRYDSLIRLGIPESKCHIFETPVLTSGYDMGELVEVFCGNILIYSQDKREGTGEVGYLKFKYTKKQLKELFELLERHNKQAAKRIGKETYEMWNKYKELFLRGFVAHESVYKVENIVVM